jgi:hypothetical protein
MLKRDLSTTEAFDVKGEKILEHTFFDGIPINL